MAINLEHFVTLFDSNFLPQGIALHASMERHINQYKLWIVCIDELSFEVLDRLRLPNIQILSLSNLESDELKRVKQSRTASEYCWTVTPFTSKYVFEADLSVQRVTYIDADIYFLKSPKPIFERFKKSNSSIMITNHAFSPSRDASKLSGTYCVQFMVYERETSEEVRQRWEDQCIEWCFNRFESGKFGDQKYLEEWPKLYGSNIYVLEEDEYCQGPWNCTRFPFGDAIIYHFHGLRLQKQPLGGGYSIDLGNNFIPLINIESFYKPYLLDLRAAIKLLKNVNFQVKPQRKFNGFKAIKMVSKLIRNKGSEIYFNMWNIKL